MRSTIAVAAGLAAVASAVKPSTSTVTVDVTITSCDPTHTGNCPYKPTATGDWEEWTSTTTDCGPTVTATTVTGTNSAGKVYSYTKTITVDTCTTTDSDTTTDGVTTTTWADWCGPTTTTTVSAGKTKTITVFPEDCTSTDSATTTTTEDADHTWSDWTSSSTPVDPVDPVDPSSTWGDWTSAETTEAPATTASPEGCGAAPAGVPAWISLLPADKSSSIAAKWATGAPADWCYYTYSASIATSVAPTGTAVSPAGGKPSSVVAPYGGTATGVSPATYTGAASSNAGSLVIAGLAAAAVMVIA